MLVCGAATVPAWGTPGPPFITDDPEPVEFQHYEVYIASITSRFFGQSTGTLPHLEVNYGGAPNVQFHIIAPMAYATASGQPFNYGYGDTEVGIKYRFVQENDHRPMVGIFPLVEVPTGNRSKGLSTGQTAFFLPVWLQKSYGNWTAYGGGGYWNNPGPGNLNYWFTGLTLQCQATKNLMIGGEFFHTTQQVVGESSITAFNIGGVYDFDEGHHLMMSIGTGLRGNDNGTTYFAYQWTFGPKEKKEKEAK
ncbi:MAG: hypothetical protein P4L46_09990 [Fimbriimonas sp.]|nr:hypothetical protein [Fimbriimonas sp.]